jgi:alpha-D-xyloside xylohydrolase
VRQFTAQPVSGPTTLRIHPGTNGAFTLYDDDGQSLGYRDGSDARTVWINLRWDDAKRVLTIAPDDRIKKWPGSTRTFATEVRGEKGVRQTIEFNGRTIRTRF